jgi:hypothetical protein
VIAKYVERLLTQGNTPASSFADTPEGNT